MDGIMTIRLNASWFVCGAVGGSLLGIAVARRNPAIALFGLIFLGIGYFLYNFTTEYFHSNGLNDVSLLWVGWSIAILVWFGIHLATKKDFTRMFASSFISLGVVGLNFYILRWMFGSDYRLDDPGDVMALGWFCGAPIALGFGWLAIWRIAEGRKGVYAVAIFVAMMWLGSFWLNLTALNNILFGGCFPSTPIGQKCDLPTSRNMMPIATVDTPIAPPAKDTGVSPLIFAYNEVTMPKGGSLCGTLGMTPMEAKAFGKANHLRISYKGHKLFVLVKPGWIFRNPGNGTWVLVKK